MNRENEQKLKTKKTKNVINYFEKKKTIQTLNADKFNANDAKNKLNVSH